MSNWPGKYVIGLTGNIATGKSVVRRMLEHLGAYTIDADALSHRAITKGAPGYQPVVETFGKFILDSGGEIDRVKLGKLVFSNPDALKKLEEIVHPLVEHAVDLMVKRASQQVVVIEAIKLLEGKLASQCDTIWITYAPELVQKIRLMEKRGMNEQDAIHRIQTQPSQEKRMAAANLVIKNTGSFDETWKQVVAAWKGIPLNIVTAPVAVKKVGAGEFVIQRGHPQDSKNIAALISRLSNGTRLLTSEDIMAAFGDKAFLLLMTDNELVGIAGWQVENLVVRTTDIYIDPRISTSLALSSLINEVERASQELQCEASLLFLTPQLAAKEGDWKDLGYTIRTPQSLGVRAWQDAAHESQPSNTVLLFKQLRVDRILRPI